MKYESERARRIAGVCIKCEAVPVVGMYCCHDCYVGCRTKIREKMRRFVQCKPRQHWNPTTQTYVTIDDLEAYDRIRADIATEVGAGATAASVCEKYKLSSIRLRKICIEFGVTLARKQGERAHVKTPERLALEAAVIADAKAGMVLKDLKAKYPGHEVRYICVRNGVSIARVVNETHELHADSRSGALKAQDGDAAAGVGRAEAGRQDSAGGEGDGAEARGTGR